MNLRIFIIISLIAIICSCSDSQQNSSNKENLGNLTISAELGSLWKADSTYCSIGAPPTSWVMDVRIVFNNETADTIKFQSMSCSFPDEFSINDTIHFGILPSVCFSNIPVNVSIPPYYKTDRMIRVFWKDKQQKSDDQFEIGLRKQELNEGKTIWSNPIKMKRLHQHIYK